MASVLAIAAATSAGGLFSYNRENFFFDKHVALKQAYQGFGMRIKQFELYRQDVRDLVGLTVRKMDNYLIVNTLQLGFSVTLFTEGRPRPDENGICPAWLIMLYALCNAGAFFYYLLSIWLAVHASVAAHSFGVRLLTQFVRLPVPGEQTLDQARALAQDFEAMRMRDVFRIPVLRQQLRKLQHAMSAPEDTGEAESDIGDSISDPGELGSTTSRAYEPQAFTSPVATLEHVRLFRQLQANWQSYDAYSRVCMAMGTNQLLHALSYSSLGLLIAQNHVPDSALCCVAIFTTSAWIIARLDLYSGYILTAFAFLLVAPPTLATVSLYNNKSSWPHRGWYAYAVPVIFLLHVVWIIFTVHVARAREVGEVALPTKFRSVLFLDVFGWLREPAARARQGRDTGEDSDGDDGTPSRTPSLVTIPTSAGVRQLSTVPEAGLPARLQGSASTAALAPTMRAQLIAQSRQLRRQLDEDLQRWEEENVQALLRDVDPRALEEIARTRALAASLAPMLAEVENSTQEANEAEGADALPAAPQPQTWLRLNWNPSGHPLPFYYQCGTNRTSWEAPGSNARVCDLAALQQEAVNLKRHVKALKGSRQGRESISLEPGARAGSPAVPRGGSPGRGSAPRVGSPGAASSRSSGHAEEHSSRAAALAASSFHPAGPDPARARHSRHPPPGKLPWQTVFQGSIVLIMMWSAGTVWSFLHLTLGWDLQLGIRHAFEKVAAPPPLPGILPVPERLPIEGLRPHAFFRPTALACNPAFDAGMTLLVAEKYRVHRLQYEEHGNMSKMSWAPRAEGEEAALARCLAAAQAFQARGLGGVALECGARENSSEAAADCAVVLLGTGGHRLLRCSLATQVSKVDVIPLLGGPWKAVASEMVAHQGGSAGRAIWALRSEASSPALLRRVVPDDSSPVMKPQLDLPGDSKGVAALHAADSCELLGLTPGGMLYSWPLRSGGLPRSWQLPNVSVEWKGLCASESSIYLAGTSLAQQGRQSDQGGIWRVARPGPGSCEALPA